MNRIENVRVVAPARLHMGFLDPSATLNRKFGSIGVALNEIATEVKVSRARQLQVFGAQTERIQKITQKVLHALRIREGVQVEIERMIPEHVGLGSGTQMALAIGFAVSKLFGIELSVREVACLTDRGARSGIGIATFEYGGLIVDGGRAPETETPPIISRIRFPAQWRFILVFDERVQGLNGVREIEAFQRLRSFPEASAARICHLLLMQGLPALVERDILGFGQAITEIQQTVGDYFAPAQGGRFMSPEVEAAINWLGSHGAVATGQSSWGPTGFCVVETETEARELVDGLSGLLRDKPELTVRIVSAQNEGRDARFVSPCQMLPERTAVRLNGNRN
ncbi:MAG: beta-ribofuranosylaminobenzene 5'-phosphate synthase family protein [Gammaproteobacteria bacterium]